MLKERNIVTLLLFMAFVLCGHAQDVTYNHDESKMQQVLVMETGGGIPSPDLYYSTLHSSYKKTARTTSKLLYRTDAYIADYNQVEYADSIDSCFTKRAAIEALNVADREIDLAWQTEGDKIEKMLERFEKNINRIVAVGGSVEDRERWKTYYNMYEIAIKETKDAYMPNAQRKREYLGIYADIVGQNEILVKSLVAWNKQTWASKALTYKNNYQKSTKASAISAAYNKWRSAGRNGCSTARSSTNGDDDSGGEDTVNRQ